MKYRVASMLLVLGPAAGVQGCKRFSFESPQASAIKTTAPGTPVDASTMSGKMLSGYQGWFTTPHDGSQIKGWNHWFRDNTPDTKHLVVDLWPDVSEYDDDELEDTGLKLVNGKSAKLFSAYNPKTVLRHFRWMRDYQLDGALLQRFIGEVQDPRFFDFRNKVTRNVMAAAEDTGRVFAIEYDVSTAAKDADHLVDWLETDWKYLVDVLKVTDSPRYLHHKGKPVLFLWGLGFSDRVGTPAQARELISWFKVNSAARYQVTVVGGVPAYWQSTTVDSKPGSEWLDIYHSYDVVSPWTVGRYSNPAGVDAYRSSLLDGDIADTKAAGIEYMPVIFPGFSWANLNGDPVNQVHREDGKFYWRQVYQSVRAGATMLKTAMFDEMNEGTAIFKIAPPGTQPAGSLMSYEAGTDSGTYLSLAAKIAPVLKEPSLLTPEVPRDPVVAK